MLPERFMVCPTCSLLFALPGGEIRCLNFLSHKANRSWGGGGPERAVFNQLK